MLTSKFRLDINALLLLLLTVCWQLPVSASALSVTVTPSAPSVPRYDVYELTLGHTANYTYPNDDVTIAASFTAPSGKTFSVGGFFYDVNAWKVRFAPNETGTWSWSLNFTAPDGSFASTGNFSCAASARSGFVRLHPTSSYRLITEDTGKAFFPIGIQQGYEGLPNNPSVGGLSWFLPPTGNPGSTNNSVYPVSSDTYFAPFAQAGFNLYRDNGESQNVLLDFNTSASGKNQYDIQRSKNTDLLCSDSHRHQLKLMLCFSANPHFYVGDTWDLSNPAVKQAWLRHHQYCINRYGAYVDIWELANEWGQRGEPTQAYYDTVTQYVHNNDPYQHLITISYQPTHPQPLIDIGGPHYYIGSSNLDLDDQIVNGTYGLVHNTFLNKPIIISEVGNNAPIGDNDMPLEERYRIFLWTSFFNRAAIIPWDGYNGSGQSGTGVANLYVGSTQRGHASKFSAYVSDFDPNAIPVSVTMSPANAMRGYVLGSNQCVGGWFTHTTSHSTTLSGATVTLNIPAAGMAGQWIDPASGNVLQSFSPASGTQTLNVPAFASDIALKILGGGGPLAPSITTQPQNQTVAAGQTATFTVAASGTGPLAFQWKKNGSPIGGATSASYTTPATTTTDSGAAFLCVVTNAVGSASSNAALLTVNATAVAPSVTTQPVNQTVAAGQTATFSIVAAGTAPLTYQWKKNGSAIAGATSASYTTPATTTADSGAAFLCVVSNAVGSATSIAAILTVLDPGPSITSPASAVPNPATVGQSVAFTVAANDPDGDTLLYRWSFGDGSTGSGNSISHAYSAAGVFAASVTVDDGKGTTVVSNVNVSVTTATTSSALKINFQPASAIVPAGYLADSGAVYAARGNGQSYGWDIDLSAQTSKRNLNSDPRLDTAVFTWNTTRSWSCALANGNYLVTLASGDAQWYHGQNWVELQGAVVINNVASAPNQFLVLSNVPVTVSNGKLTVRIGNGSWETALNYVDITPVSGGNQPPLITTAASATPNAVTVGQNVAFSVAASDPNGDALSYSWALGDGATASGSTTSHAFAAIGNFTATVTVSDGKGGMATSSTAVTVTSPIQPGVVKINFQPSGAVVPAGYLADAGAPYADRGNGQTYGWDLDLSGQTWQRHISSDARLDTAVFTWGTTRTWTCSVANGNYSVKLLSGDPQWYHGQNWVELQGAVVINNAATAANQYITVAAPVTVSNGKLVIRIGNGSWETALNYIEITPVPGGAATASSAPEVSLPTTLAMTVTHAQISTKFNAAGRDVCKIKGTLPQVSSPFDPAGKSLLINIAGVSAPFILDARGKAKSLDGSVIALVFKSSRTLSLDASRNAGFQKVAFTLMIKNGAWTKLWNSDGTGTDSAPRSVMASVQLEGSTYLENVQLAVKTKNSSGMMLSK